MVNIFSGNPYETQSKIKDNTGSDVFTKNIYNDASQSIQDKSYPEVSTKSLDTTSSPIGVIPSVITSNILQDNSPNVSVPTQQAVPTPQLPVVTTTAEDPYKIMKDYISSLTAPTSVANEYTNLYGQPSSPEEIASKRKNVADLSTRLNTINTNAQVAKQQLESQAIGKDVTTSFLGRQQQEIDRQAIIQGLPVAAQLSATQGDLVSAQNYIDKLFEFKVADASARNDFNNKLKDIAYAVATDVQKQKLDEQIRKETRADTIANNNRTEIKDYASKALTGGDPQLMAQILSLDENSPSFKSNLSKLVSKIKENPTDILDRQLKQAQIAKTLKEARDVGKEDSAKAIAQKKTEETSLNNLREKISAIDILKGSRGMAGTVGAYGIARFTPLTIDKSERQDFIAGVKNLVSQDTLDTLLELKKAGGTLGAISEKELDILQSSASKINSWEIKDKNGKVTGFEIGEKEFTDELNRIQKSAQKIIDAAEGKNVDSYLDTALDVILNNSTSSIYSSAGYNVSK